MSLVIKVVKANVWVIWIFCNRSYPKKKWIANGFKPQAHKASISLIIQAWFTNIQLVSCQQAWLIYPCTFIFGQETWILSFWPKLQTFYTISIIVREDQCEAHKPLMKDSSIIATAMQRMLLKTLKKFGERYELDSRSLKFNSGFKPDLEVTERKVATNLSMLKPCWDGVTMVNSKMTSIRSAHIVFEE